MRLTRNFIAIDAIRTANNWRDYVSQKGNLKSKPTNVRDVQSVVAIVPNFICPTVCERKFGALLRSKLRDLSETWWSVIEKLER